jgi:hypothetical protein
VGFSSGDFAFATGWWCSEIRSSWQDVASRLKAVIKDTNSLLEFYYSVGGLLSLKVTPSNPLAGWCFFVSLALGGCLNLTPRLTKSCCFCRNKASVLFCLMPTAHFMQLRWQQCIMLCDLFHVHFLQSATCSAVQTSCWSIFVWLGT